MISHRSFIKVTALFLMISWVSTNTVPHFLLLLDTDIETFEYCDPIDSETEKEEEKNDEKDEFRLEFLDANLFSSAIIALPHNACSLQSLHRPETTTPPPEHSSSI